MESKQAIKILAGRSERDIALIALSNKKYSP
jgi:hypothetical protein